MIPNNRYLVHTAALAMLLLVAVLMFSSARNDAIIVDEDPHIGAGYSYLKKGDYRLNPEHPPLMKDLGALPLLFMNLNEPWDHKSWATDINGQWEFGRKLIFNSDNDADAITRAAKAPMIVLTVLLGAFIFWWTRKNFGNAAGLLTLFLYAFSPTFLAHGRFVTTDVGATAGFFLGMIAFLRFLKAPTKKNIVLTGLAMGFAFLTKFSTFELVPIALILLLGWTLACGESGARIRFFLGYLGKTIVVFFIAYLVIYPVYLHHTWNYPPERQKTDTEFILASFQIRALGKASGFMESHRILPQHADEIRDFPKNLVIWASDKSVLRPWAEYFLGLLMVFQRSAGGNTTYFLGGVSGAGSRIYFPFMYLVKEPLALHVLSLIALAWVLARVKRPDCRREWLKNHFIEFAFLVIIAFYWWASIRSILNIGVRHILPTFPFVYVLVSAEVVKLYKKIYSSSNPALYKSAGASRSIPYGNFSTDSTSSLQASSRRNMALWGFRMILAALLGWQAFSVLRVHPSYLAYFNEFAGGPDGGYRYVTDSNLDWGQDLKRLAQFFEERNIPEIHLDYFGWADPAYYLKEKYRWLSSSSEPRKGWVAVSATFYQGSREEPEHDYRRWLPTEKLVAKIGYSIFVFHLE